MPGHALDAMFNRLRVEFRFHRLTAPQREAGDVTWKIVPVVPGPVPVSFVERRLHESL